MKKIVILIGILILLMSFTSPQSISKSSLSKKWYLEKYEIFWVDYEPEEEEKNDYIWLKKDMTYQSMDKGKLSNGKWSLNVKKKTFTLFNKKGEGIAFKIEKLTTKKLVVVMDVEEMKKVKIHFKAKK